MNKEILKTNYTEWFENLDKELGKYKNPRQYLLDRLFYAEQENKKLNKYIEYYQKNRGQLPVILKTNTALKFINSIREFILIREPDKIGKLIINNLVDIFKYDRAGLMLYDKERKLITGIASYGLPEEYIKNLNISPEETEGEKMRNFLAQSFSYGKSIFINRRFDELFYNERMDQTEKIYSSQYVLVPIKGKERKYGVITIAVQPDGKTFLTPPDITILEFYSHLIGIAFENAEMNLKIESFYKDLILTFSNLVEFRDEGTSGHCKRLIHYARLLGNKLGLTEEEIKELELAAAMHDIGKIATPDSILSKPGKLTEKEYEKIKEHSIAGSEMVRTLKDYKNVIKAIKHHHERWDGKGYPDKLKGNKIPLFARILAVIDAYDVMINERPYKDAMPEEEAKQELIDNSGKQFDPEIVGLFLSRLT